MPPKVPDIEQIVQEITVLPPEDRIRLIGRIVETVVPSGSTGPGRTLIYGEFRGPRLSCEEDFREAEWHPRGNGFDGH